ncbi:DUF2066 domain-containing protein [Methylophaga sp.]|uniref:DUF2066 domain-containing protein n=1 Tax=Methylophaga sp. TaxID=2024840 RepID=UPI00140010E8|nr:DUF2066 domain-containing protein [Methylophaga sp.]MTI63983.1 DUF2066 domain-containing protein [Methylophaga sp.]
MHRLFIALILLSLTFGSQAAEVDNLYQASTPVSSRDQQERAKLMPQLLQQVMLKVVGNQALLETAPLAPVLSRAEQFMQQYEYRRTNIIGADLTQPDELSLSMRFDPAAVNRAVKELQLPVWGNNRPDILIWAVVDNNGEASILGLESSPMGVFRPLNQAADQRGLPILLPLMDLQDQGALSVADIREDNQAAIDAASDRYGADIVMTSVMQFNGDQVQVQWQANGAGINTSWQSQGSVREAFAAGMGHLADNLALQFGQLVDNGSESQRLTMQINDVLSYADFSRLMAYLEKLELISDIRVINLGAQQLDLDIAFRGSMDVLQKTLAVGSLLIEEPQSETSDTKQYRLLH